MELTIQAASHEEAMALFGLGDRNLKLLRDAFPVQLVGRGTTLRVAGEREPVEKVAGLLNGLVQIVRAGRTVPPEWIENEIARNGPGRAATPRAEASGDDRQEKVPAPLRSHGEGRREEATPHGIARSKGQEKYLEAIQQNEIVFCIGPAGTGKTYLAVRMAVNFLRDGAIKRIILCRPAVEAGERLGFLPGDFQAKINPYLRPLYDALNDILDYDQVKRYLEREIIEILPLAYMRGRTLQNAFIILDEGQNTSVSQMKMFLTRMGMSSRIVVNGDVTQVDLPEGVPSGLIHARKIIRGIQGIGWIELLRSDIVRHPLVKKVLEAYEGAEQGGH